MWFPSWEGTEEEKPGKGSGSGQEGWHFVESNVTASHEGKAVQQVESRRHLGTGHRGWELFEEKTFVGMLGV